MLREEITVEQDISEAPSHGSDKKQDKERVSSLPRTATKRREKQRNISNCSY